MIAPKASSPLMVMPPLYQFDLPNHKKESKWGWHRATELWEVVQNLLHLQGQGVVDPIALIREHYSFVELMKVSSDGFCECYLTIDQDGRMWSRNSAWGEWLHWSIKDDHYIPAKAGMQLIQAVKRPMLSSVRHALTKKVD